METKVKNMVKKDKKKALEYIKNKEKGKKLIDEAVHKARNEDSGTKEFKSDLKISISMFKSFLSGEYKNISKRTIITIVAAILYFVNPFDVVPDFILYAGYIDDALVFSMLLRSIKKEIENYKKWQSMKEY
ncbi:YkvA family protein [Senegalia massiliensis]|uniref:YkvA family protein n=1 Tax=Senegalia massiliensis TaxID=1720316 RepID=UPI001030CFF8|nr:YkvA family protein [Senegalia massiliensis]